jgi:hypothetical protein
MRRYTLAALTCGAGLLMALVLVGCGPGTDDDEYDSGKVAKKKKEGPHHGIEAGNGTVLKGKVTISGTAPDPGSLKQAFADQVRSKKADQFTQCVTDAPEEQKRDPAWSVADEGVGNVVVWLMPPDNDSYFKFDEETLNRFWDKDGVKGPKKDYDLNQPHCVFVPRVGWVFPSYTNPASTVEQVPSGQTFVVKNGATIAHNTNYSGGPNKGDLGVLAPQSQTGDLSAKLQYSYKAPAHFVCNIHGWMEADVWVFNHPYAAVTNPDGTYAIYNVPSDAKVKIVAWHPKIKDNFLTPSKANGDDLQLNKETTTHDFTLNAPGG